MLDVRFFANPRFTAASVTVTLVFFALFGFIFLATQYLQFVLGYSRVRGRRPHAAVRVRADGDGAVCRRRWSQWFGTKRVVVTGMLVFAVGLVVASTSTVDVAATRVVMLAMVLMGAGMGLSVAPATESIMGSLPLHQAGVGSAVNDTSREVGGALGVAIVGSMLSSLYSTDLNAKLPANVPGQVRAAADQSVGAALHVSAQLGRVGAPARRRGARVVRLRDVAGVAGHRGGGARGRAPRLAVPAGSRGRGTGPGGARAGRAAGAGGAGPGAGEGELTQAPRVDSAPPSRPPGTAPLHLRHLGSIPLRRPALRARLRFISDTSGRRPALRARLRFISDTSVIPLRRPALRARLRFISDTSGRFRSAVPPSGHGSASSPTPRVECAPPSVPPGTAPLHFSRSRRGQWGTTGRCRRGRSSRPGSWPGTAGDSPRRRRRSRRVGSRW